MSGMDDYFKSLDYMTQGVKSLATTLAVNDTTSKLHAAQANAKNDQEKMAINRQFGNDLALRLTAIGSSPQAIAQATNGLAPSASEAEQSQSTRDVEKMKMDFERDKLKETADYHKKQLEALMGKSTQKDAKYLNDLAAKFQTQPDVQPILKGMNALDESLTNFDETKGKFGSTMAANLAKMGILKSMVSRITDREYQAANETATGRGELWKKMRTQFGVTGEQPQSITEFWQKIVQAHKDKALDILDSKAKGYAKSLSINDKKVDPEQMYASLKEKHGLGRSADSAAHISDALDWLGSEDGQKADPTERQDVINAIKKMQGH